MKKFIETILTAGAGTAAGLTAGMVASKFDATRKAAPAVGVVTGAAVTTAASAAIITAKLDKAEAVEREEAVKTLAAFRGKDLPETKASTEGLSLSEVISLLQAEAYLYKINLEEKEEELKSKMELLDKKERRENTKKDKRNDGRNK